MTLQRWRPWLPGALIAAVLTALFLWVVSTSEWVDEDVRRPLTGKAALDDLYALERVLQRVGVKTVKRDDLSQLPPPGATLLLRGWIWDLLPERDRALRAWVEQGGHLVIEASMLVSRPRGANWIPINLVPLQSQDSKATSSRFEKECARVAEPEGVPAAYPGEGAAPGFRLCISAGAPLSTRETPLWALASEDGNDLLRVALEGGTVTVVRGWSFGWPDTQFSLFGNSRILSGDNALIAVAALQARPGAEVWLVSGRGGQPLLAWLWSRARVAVVLGLFALALWLWRASARFGPIEASPPVARRSMSEQISGTATFLWRRSPEALHAAQVRALDEAAALRVREYARLDRVDRAAAIAAATGIGAPALARALNPAAVEGAHALPRVLTTLETARRRLLQQARTPAPSIGSRRAIPTFAPEGSR